MGWFWGSKKTDATAPQNKDLFLGLHSPIDNTSSIFIKEWLLAELFAVASSQAFAAASAISFCLISSGDGPSSTGFGFWNSFTD